jgi:hypothetical protein
MALVAFVLVRDQDAHIFLAVFTCKLLRQSLAELDADFLHLLFRPLFHVLLLSMIAAAFFGNVHNAFRCNTSVCRDKIYRALFPHAEGVSGAAPDNHMVYAADPNQFPGFHNTFCEFHILPARGWITA